MQREQGFPLRLFEIIYQTIRIQDAHACTQDDKTCSLKSIAGSKAHPEEVLERINRALWSILAERVVNQSAQRGSLWRAIAVLRADTHRRKLTLDFNGCCQLSDLTPLYAIRSLQNLSQ